MPTQEGKVLRLIGLASLLLPGCLGRAQGTDVSGTITFENAGANHHWRSSEPAAQVVVWLSPVHLAEAEAPRPHGQFQLVQKDKQFLPHLLVVPTGSTVEFPNKDPFFHNVFSLFNGKRFDLGLYEPGTTRSVRFDREGVSYIFCNIHPEMGAVVLALGTPYYAVSTPSGSVLLRNLPPGTYELHVWSETHQPADPAGMQHTVQVGSTPVQLGAISMKHASDPLPHHTNKFGEPYPPSHEHPY